jgi:3-deoxy-manno-octulosonate cytidylyltransferase (CMP-KDO synthetase)
MRDRPSNRVLGVIPARLSSTRLPNKPLYPLHGRPLIEWVWNRVKDMGVLDTVVVATDSSEVFEVCQRMGAAVEMTSPDHLSGTDRVAEVARLPRYEAYSIIANIQGDEPLVDEDHLKAAIDLVADGGWDVGTCATPVANREALEDPSVVKVARAASGSALYFSRAPIPFKRDGAETPGELGREPFLRHIGIYTYTRPALEHWVSLETSVLERTEKLEQLRPLEAGLRIGVALVGQAERGVDTPADAVSTENRLRALGMSPLAQSEA